MNVIADGTATPSNTAGAPFFVIGSPRSGTTLLRLMLSNNPKLVIPPECGFVVWLYPEYGAFTARQLSGSGFASRFAASVSATRKFDTWEIECDALSQALTNSELKSYGDACSCIYRTYCRSRGKPTAIWGDKNNFYLSHIDTLKKIYSSASFIHIVRDGRDVACSYREVMDIRSESAYRPDLPTGIAEIAARWAEDIRDIRSQLSFIPKQQVIEVRYEDLVQEPIPGLKRICAWLDVPYADEMMAFHKTNLEFELEPRATIDWKRRTLEPVSARTVGRFSSVLSQSEIADFNEVAGNELRIYGYSD